jgi:amino acid adenylation domain-containing protein
MPTPGQPFPMPSGETVVARDDPAEPVFLGRGSDLPTTGQEPVHELVASLARTQPTAMAVQCDGSDVSYGELVQWAGQLAASLARVDVRPRDRVGILAEPSAAMVAAVAGTLQAGAAYVPLDPACPDQRMASLLADAKVAGVLATRTLAHRLIGWDGPVVQVGDHPDPEPPRPAGLEPAHSVQADDPAYLIYTSGTTGEPKGVLVEHGQLAASTLARRCVYPGAPVFLLLSPLAFDSSAAGLWGTLTAGGRLVVATSDEVRDPGRLVELIQLHQVTRMLCVPSLYAALLEAAARLGPQRLRSLETVITAGEALPQPLVYRHFEQHAGQVALVNEYGPTEATVWASYHRFDAPGPVSIGKPVPGARLYVLDEHLRPVPREAEGELFIGGHGVSRGYFDRPEATARAFLEDPFGDSADARMYRTGDRVRWNSRGLLEFLGRRDCQVKIRGHRVELGAVEAALQALAGTFEAVVVPDSESTELVGFVRAAPDLDVQALRRSLANLLPAPMVPAQIHVLDRFPLLTSGKVDRGQLLRLTASGLPRAEQAAAVDADDITKRVATAWAEVLKLSSVPRDVNFFDLGGHSLTVFRLQDALERHTGTRPSAVTLFRHTTVSAQAALIKNGVTGRSEPTSSTQEDATRRTGAVRARFSRATAGM